MNVVPTNETIKNEKNSRDKTKSKLDPEDGTLNLSLGVAYEMGQIDNRYSGF